MNERRNVIRLSIGVASCLAVMKFIVGLITHSMGILASSIDSLLDVFVSSVNYFTLRKSEKPPDANHAYGHGKAESLAGLFQSLFIGVSGTAIIAESVRRLIFHTHEVIRVDVGLATMIVSVAATALLVWRLKVVSLRKPSLILDTERLHFISDLATNAGVMIILFLVKKTGFFAFDLLISLAIAFYIFWLSMKLLRRSIDELMDREISPELHERIRKIILAHDSRIINLHNLRTRRVGSKAFIDFHVVLQGENSFREAHHLTESLIAAIQKEIPDCDLTVHTDPEGET
ncbi:MAG: cation diffusion facilitator family transporter [Candidatus Omnitrophota bacterium]